MSDNKTKRKILFQLLCVYIIVSVVHLLLFGVKHPLTTLLLNAPLWIQIPAVSLYGLIVYAIPGYFFVIAKPNKEALARHLGYATVILALILSVVFIALYTYSYIDVRRMIWIAYSSFNPVFGTFIYDILSDTVSLFWVVSAWIPGIGLFIGVKLRLNQEEVN